MTWTPLLAWIGAALAVAAFFMKTMIPLRVVSLVAHVFFLAYGLFAGAYYVLLAYGVTFPFNVWRLQQMRRLVANVKQAAEGDLSVKWLLPFMKEQRHGDGHPVFIKGDAADQLYFITKGTVRLAEIGEELSEGHLLGEIGFFTPDGKRTLSAFCVGDCVLHSISASAFTQLYHQNPEFGFYVVRLIARRLTADIERLRAINQRPPTDLAT